MASRRLALMGAREGPQVYIAGINAPQLRVRGMRAGFIEAEILIVGCSVPFLWTIGSDGDHPLSEHSKTMASAKPQWIKLWASVPSPSLLCEVISKVA